MQLTPPHYPRTFKVLGVVFLLSGLATLWFSADSLIGPPIYSTIGAAVRGIGPIDVTNYSIQRPLFLFAWDVWLPLIAFVTSIGSGLGFVSTLCISLRKERRKSAVKDF
jgi:hypothetical protein